MKNFFVILLIGMCFYSCDNTSKTKSHQYSQPTSTPLNSENSTGYKYNSKNIPKIKSHQYSQPTSILLNPVNSAGYKYNSKDRSSIGEYNYNYDVSGYGEDGYVTGNIDIEGKYGSGYLEDEDGNEIEIDVEWIDYGELEATDEYGNTYELEVD